MRKSALVKKTVELIDALNALQHQLENVKLENEELKEKLKELESQKTVLPEQITQSEGFVVFDEEPEEVPESATEPIELATPDTALEYGAVAIGRVVQESVKYANLISESNSENKKELLNLIMGKAEIAKTDIFSIAEGDAESDTKQELITAVLDETIDYFKSVAGQI